MIISEYQRWCIILYCRRNRIRKKLRTDCFWRHSSSSIKEKCVSISAFLWNPHGSPSTFVSILRHLFPRSQYSQSRADIYGSLQQALETSNFNYRWPYHRGVCNGYMYLLTRPSESPYLNMYWTKITKQQSGRCSAGCLARMLAQRVWAVQGALKIVLLPVVTNHHDDRVCKMFVSRCTVNACSYHTGSRCY